MGEVEQTTELIKCYLHHLEFSETFLEMSRNFILVFLVGTV